MSGMFENWLYKLVAALQMREKEANVVVVDWLPLAHQLYTDAVNNTRVVGHSVARMLNWLQVSAFKSRILNLNLLKKIQGRLCSSELRASKNVFGIQIFTKLKYHLKYLKAGTFGKLFSY